MLSVAAKYNKLIVQMTNQLIAQKSHQLLLLSGLSTNELFYLATKIQHHKIEVHQLLKLKQ